MTANSSTTTTDNNSTTTHHSSNSGGVEYFLLEEPAAHLAGCQPTPWPSSSSGVRSTTGSSSAAAVALTMDGDTIYLEPNHNTNNNNNTVTCPTTNTTNEEPDLTVPLLSTTRMTGEECVPLALSSASLLPNDDDMLANPFHSPRMDSTGIHSSSRRRSTSRRSASRSNAHHHHHTSTVRTELSGLNYLNGVAYILHVAVWWGVAVYGLDGLLDTQWEVTRDHGETLVTPSMTNYLWIPILITQGLFAVAQLAPHYRSRPIVTNGTGFYFFYTVLLQIALTVLYAFHLFIFSFVAALLALTALLSLLASQQRHDTLSSSIPTLPSHFSLSTASRNRAAASSSSSSSITEYILFRFPFLLHAGWMTLMSVDHFSLLFRHFAPHNIGLQLAGDIVALSLFLPVATVALNNYQPTAGPDFVIAGVMLWCYIGIAVRLNDPSEAMVADYGPVIIEAVLVATYCFIGLVGCNMIPYIILVLAREFCTINVIELE